jgi:hypothetical protein
MISFGRNPNPALGPGRVRTELQIVAFWSVTRETANASEELHAVTTKQTSIYISILKI